QNTADDVQLLWLQNSGTAKVEAAATAIEDFIDHGTVNVFVYPSTTPTSVPARQVFDRVLWGASLRAAGLAGPASRPPDILVTLKPGYINVGGNPAAKYTFKRAEHGGFVADDTHVPLIMSGGLIPVNDRGAVETAPVTTTQIAVSALEALG